MSQPWRLERGAIIVRDGVRFSVWAPRARKTEVHVRANRRPRIHVLDPLDAGVFETVVEGVGAGADYWFRIDEEPLRPDPVSRHQPEGVFGPSRVVDPAAFPWTDRTWRGIEMADLIVCEVHVGTATPGGTFDALAEDLPRLRDVGFTAVELMPVAQFPGPRNWGYDGVFPYAPQDTYGGPEGLRRLVDRAHALNLAVILDVVYNHMGPEGGVLCAYGPYDTDRYTTPWGPALNFDGPDSDEVRRYVIDNALHWIAEYHVDGLRLDALSVMWDLTAIDIREELAERVHALAAELGRAVLLIAETDLNDPRFLRRPEFGGFGLDGQWNDDFHHALHAVVTTERRGYYADFGGVEPLARAMKQPYVLDGRYSAYRGRRHGRSSGDLPADRFVVFAQNHDQIGNRVSGDRLSTTVGGRRARLATCVALLSPYVPLLFMGEEYGETNPFAFFVSHHDPDLLDHVRRRRLEEGSGHGGGGQMLDPTSPETFESSRLDRSKAGHGPHAETLRLTRDVIALRRSVPALRPGASKVSTAHDEDGSWLGWVLCPRRGEGDPIAVAVNFSTEPRDVRLPVHPGRWQLRCCTDWTQYGGRGTDVPLEIVVVAERRVALTLPGETLAAYLSG
jgi:maltooligosyltrehalose trehalohydrolase